MSNELHEARINTLKGVSSLRKALVDAQKWAMMAADDLENVQYTSGPAIQAIEGADEKLSAAVKSIMGIATYIGKAIQLSEASKSALREINLDDIPLEAEATGDALPTQQIPQAAQVPGQVPNQQQQQAVASRAASQIRRFGRTAWDSDSLAAQRKIARLKRRGLLEG